MRPFAKRPDAKELDRIAQVTQAEVPAGRFAPAQGAAQNAFLLQVGQVVDVPVHELKSNPLNARRTVSPAGLDDLGQRITVQGQLTSALAYIDEYNNICLIDGHRRLEACRIAGLPTLRVEIRPRPESEQELYLASRSANVDREAQTPLDDALAWKMLLDRKIFPSQAELARRLGIDPTALNRTLGLADFPKPLISMLTERPALMNLRMLDALKRFNEVAGEQETESLLIEVASQDLSSRDVDSRRIAFQKEPVTRARGNTLPFRYPRGNAVIKRYAGQGRLMLEIKEVTEEHLVDQLQEELNKLVAKLLSK